MVICDLWPSLMFSNKSDCLNEEAFILVHRAVFITSYCVSYDFILLFINNSNPYNIDTGNTRIII